MNDQSFRESVKESAGPNRHLSHVVGIGASAGGLEALEQVFQNMPSDTGMAFVVIQHLSPDFESMMDELLIRRTEMPVHMVSDGMMVEPNSIYLIPPKKEMIISDGRLLLTDKDRGQGLSLPIDQFFKALARDLGDKSVAIILSGTGSDGSRGICDVHDAGGLVIVQSEDTAKFDGMPKSAQETGMVDLILPPAEIGKTLGRYVARPDRSELIEEANSIDANEPGLKRLIRLLREDHGIDFSVYKQTTVLRRIERRLAMSDTGDFEEYVERVANNPKELHALYRDLLIGVTEFFRDPEAFNYLKTEVLANLLQKHPANEEFRVWIAGCATGEEAYSIAILLDELMTSLQRQKVKIFATDVHQASLDFASMGVYREPSIANVSAERREKYFIRIGTDFQIAKELRQMIVFAPQNIVKDAPFTKLDMISCRNLLIYLQPGIQKKVISLFHFGLKTNGVLLLGPSEGVGNLESEFKSIDRHWKIYSKRRDIRLNSDFRLPMGTRTMGLHEMRSNLQFPASANELSRTYDELLEQFLPPSVLINEHRQIIHVFGNAGDYLHIKRGRATGDVLDHFDSNLKTAISGAIQRVAKDGQKTAYTGISVGDEDDNRQIKVTVIPILNRTSEMTHTLITFTELEDRPAAVTVDAESMVVDSRIDTRNRIESLEEDLQHTRENLQATIEELEASNEELQATNEELVASNEEMQSTNEELHSVNEELYTVNAEYQRKIHELTELTDDVNHLLESTDVGVLFLDHELSIRKFTPSVARLFNIIDQDIGRAFSNFTHNIRHDSLLDDIQRVLSSGRPFEKDVLDRTGHDYFLRILPYRIAQEIDGVVVTLIDVASLKKAQSEIRERDERLKGILEHSPSFIYIKDLQGQYLIANSQSQVIFGKSPQDVIGKSNHDLLPVRLAERIEQNDARVAQTGETIQVELTIPSNGKNRTYLSTIYPLMDDNQRIYAIAGIKTDITGRRIANRKAKRAVRERDRFLAMLSHELRNPLAAIQNAASVLGRLEPEDDRVRRVADVVQRQSAQLSHLLDDLLDISRVVQGKIDLKRSIVDLRLSAEDAILAVRSRAVAANINLISKLPDVRLPILGDQARLQQVIVNLLVNAIKYTPDTGRVTLEITRNDGSAVIRVTDNGAGMSPAFIKRAFDPFVQGEHTIDYAQGGMGVGLTLVKSLVKLHGGTVDILSPGLGKGTEVTIRLPLLESEDSTCVEPEIGEPAELPRLKIVVAEDNRDSREMLQLLLEMEGHEVITAPEGTAALRTIESEKPDVAFIDIGLPEIDGYEVARRLCEKNVNDQVTLIALTGFGQQRDIQRSSEAGFERHLTKPLQARELELALALAADRRQRPEQNKRLTSPQRP